MYLEIKDLTVEELTLLKEQFKNRLRGGFSIYDEVCRMEADCSVERVIDELGINLTEEEYKKAIRDIAQDLANECEDNAFQEMCERADYLTKRYFS